MNRILSVAVACLMVVGTALAFRGPLGPADSAFQSAEIYLATLSAEEMRIGVQSFDSKERVAWHFIPKDVRKGVALRDMTAEQRDATLQLLRGILSDSGYQRVSGARALEGIVRDLEGDGRRWDRDPDQYYLTMFGKPTPSGRWGVSFEGHHVSLNFVFDGGHVVATTPQFLGAHPAVILPGQERAGVESGYRLLGDEAQIAFDLANSLTDAQVSVAKLSDQAPREIRGAGDAQPQYGEPKGIPGRELDRTQRKLLAALIDTYASVVAHPLHVQRLIEIRGLDDIYFSYAGELAVGKPHGYTVHGRSFVIEYVNSQPDAEGNPANHAHAIYRDLSGDFGLPM